MAEGLQPDEQNTTTHWEVQWKSKVSLASQSDHFPVHTVERRTADMAYEFAVRQRENGFETRLFRVERTEMDF